MDLNRMGQGHRIAAGAGLLLLIDLWLSWYSISDDFVRDIGGSFGVDTSATAWQAFDFTDILLAITALLAIAAATQAMGLLRLPVRLSDILFPLAAVMTLIVLYRIINQPGENEVIDVSFGAWLGLVLTAVVAYGAMSARGEAEAVGPADVRSPSEPASTTASTPPPAAPAAPAATTPPPPSAPPAADEPPSSTNP